MSCIYLPMAALFISILVNILFFSKVNVKNIETKIYGYLLILNLIHCLYNCIVIILIKQFNIVIPFLHKLDIMMIMYWVSGIFAYMVALSLPIKNYRKLGFTLTIINIIISIIILSLPMTIINEGEILNTVGPATDSATIFVACYVISCLILYFYVRFNQKDQPLKKFIPLFVLIGVLLLGLLSRNFFPNLIIEPFMISFVNLVMFHTIENPDIRMIEQLNIARDQADKANQAKTEFLSSMSHEIRTPLNAIVGFSNLLLENKDVPESAKEDINDIIMASDNLLEIVNGILDISKIEANKMEIENQEYSFPKLVNELVSLTRGRIGEKPILFKTNIDETIPPVLFGDGKRVKQIVVNILTNAVKYTEKGWIELHISHVEKDDICHLIISVEDTGIGIKEGNINKLFNKFERLDMQDNTTIEGTGLGLAITKKLLDMMNGKIVVQSVVGKGSKFTVAIDQRIVKNPTIKEVEVAKPTTEVMATDKKVLVVDDNKINLKVAEKLLDQYSLKTDLVASGDECITKIKEGEQYDLILMDIMMPKLNGVETLHELQKLSNFNIPVVALTADALTGMREKYLKEGFNDYLAKPINKDELNRIINSYLNKE